ncbi:hypothetical protein A2U01_0102876, partial [Trifolium medium]|nr:hypothetical protein [Trifolium medium]
MGWRDAPMQNLKLTMCNGYLRVAQYSWRGAQTREIVQILSLEMRGFKISWILPPPDDEDFLILYF